MPTINDLMQPVKVPSEEYLKEEIKKCCAGRQASPLPFRQTSPLPGLPLQASSALATFDHQQLQPLEKIGEKHKILFFLSLHQFLAVALQHLNLASGTSRPSLH